MNQRNCFCKTAYKTISEGKTLKMASYKQLYELLFLQGKGAFHNMLNHNIQKYLNCIHLA